jgi:rod shape determining protein RodA
LLALFWLVLRSCFAIAREVNEPTGQVLAIGVGTWLGVQAWINMGMTMGLLPVVGLPLPFVSYGGSSLVASMAGVGLVLSVSRKT